MVVHIYATFSVPVLTTQGETSRTNIERDSALKVKVQYFKPKHKLVRTGTSRFQLINV